MLMPQWYVKCAGFAANAKSLVGDGQIQMIPERQKHIWDHWLTEIEDWCVSRQLWWGHRIPVYCVKWSGVDELWVAAESAVAAAEKARGILPADKRKAVEGLQPDVKQDEDVLDTWFSSGLLPLTMFNQPNVLAPAGNGAGALSSVLETGQDILFFWVARMAMLCTHFAQTPPFSTVLLHPMVRDSQGRKMSKSLGNVINPLDVIHGASLKTLQQTLKNGYLTDKELKKSTKELQKLYPAGFQRFGADALRFTLLLYTQQTQQINMSLDNVKASYHFCNKLWNTFKFVHMHADKVDNPSLDSFARAISEGDLTVFDRALVSRLHGMLETCDRAMRAFKPA
ncbi:hypothetical protein FBU59_001855, partial [Linderina macrospora]